MPGIEGTTGAYSNGRLKSKTTEFKPIVPFGSHLDPHLPSARLKIKCYDKSTGEPLSGVVVGISVLRDDASKKKNKKPISFGNTQTQSDGTVICKVLAGYSYAISATASGYLPFGLLGESLVATPEGNDALEKSVGLVSVRVALVMTLRELQPIHGQLPSQDCLGQMNPVYDVPKPSKCAGVPQQRVSFISPEGERQNFVASILSASDTLDVTRAEVESGLGPYGTDENGHCFFYIDTQGSYSESSNKSSQRNGIMDGVHNFLKPGDYKLTLKDPSKLLIFYTQASDSESAEMSQAQDESVPFNVPWAPGDWDNPGSTCKLQTPVQLYCRSRPYFSIVLYDNDTGLRISNDENITFKLERLYKVREKPTNQAVMDYYTRMTQKGTLSTLWATAEINELDRTNQLTTFSLGVPQAFEGTDLLQEKWVEEELCNMSVSEYGNDIWLTPGEKYRVTIMPSGSSYTYQNCVLKQTRVANWEQEPFVFYVQQEITLTVGLRERYNTLPVASTWLALTLTQPAKPKTPPPVRQEWGETATCYMRRLIDQLTDFVVESVEGVKENEYNHPGFRWLFTDSDGVTTCKISPSCTYALRLSDAFDFEDNEKSVERFITNEAQQFIGIQVERITTVSVYCVDAMTNKGVGDCLVQIDMIEDEHGEVLPQPVTVQSSYSSAETGECTKYKSRAGCLVKVSVVSVNPEYLMPSAFEKNNFVLQRLTGQHPVTFLVPKKPTAVVKVYDSCSGEEVYGVHFRVMLQVRNRDGTQTKPTLEDLSRVPPQANFEGAMVKLAAPGDPDPNAVQPNPDGENAEATQETEPVTDGSGNGQGGQVDNFQSGERLLDKNRVDWDGAPLPDPMETMRQEAMQSTAITTKTINLSSTILDPSTSIRAQAADGQVNLNPAETSDPSFTINTTRRSLDGQQTGAGSGDPGQTVSGTAEGAEGDAPVGDGLWGLTVIDSYTGIRSQGEVLLDYPSTSVLVGVEIYPAWPFKTDSQIVINTCDGWRGLPKFEFYLARDPEAFFFWLARDRVAHKFWKRNRRKDGEWRPYKPFHPLARLQACAPPTAVIASARRPMKFLEVEVSGAEADEEEEGVDDDDAGSTGSSFRSAWSDDISLKSSSDGDGADGSSASAIMFSEDVSNVEEMRRLVSDHFKMLDVSYLSLETGDLLTFLVKWGSFPHVLNGYCRACSAPAPSDLQPMLMLPKAPTGKDGSTPLRGFPPFQSLIFRAAYPWTCPWAMGREPCMPMNSADGEAIYCRTPYFTWSLPNWSTVHVGMNELLYRDLAPQMDRVARSIELLDAHIEKVLAYNDTRSLSGRFLLGNKAVDKARGGVFVVDISAAQPIGAIRFTLQQIGLTLETWAQVDQSPTPSINVLLTCGSFVQAWFEELTPAAVGMKDSLLIWYAGMKDNSPNSTGFNVAYALQTGLDVSAGQVPVYLICGGLMTELFESWDQDVTLNTLYNWQMTCMNNQRQMRPVYIVEMYPMPLLASTGANPDDGSEEASEGSGLAIPLEDAFGGMNVIGMMQDVLQSRRLRLLDLFRELDSDGDMCLNRDQLSNLVQNLLPDITPVQTRFLEIFLDSVNDNSLISFKLLGNALKFAPLDPSTTLARSHGSIEMGLMGLKCRLLCLARNFTPEELFAVYDVNQSGFWEADEQWNAITDIFPALTPSEQKALYATMQSLDLNSDSRLNCDAWSRAFGLGAVAADVSSSTDRRASQQATKTETPSEQMDVVLNSWEEYKVLVKVREQHFPLHSLLSRVAGVTSGSIRRLDMGHARAFAEQVDLLPVRTLRSRLASDLDSFVAFEKAYGEQLHKERTNRMASDRLMGGLTADPLSPATMLSALQQRSRANGTMGIGAGGGTGVTMRPLSTGRYSTSARRQAEAMLAPEVANAPQSRLLDNTFCRNVYCIEKASNKAAALLGDMTAWRPQPSSAPRLPPRSATRPPSNQSKVRSNSRQGLVPPGDLDLDGYSDIPEDNSPGPDELSSDVALAMKGNRARAAGRNRPPTASGRLGNGNSGAYPGYDDRQEYVPKARAPLNSRPTSAPARRRSALVRDDAYAGVSSDYIQSSDRRKGSVAFRTNLTSTLRQSGGSSTAWQ